MNFSFTNSQFTFIYHLPFIKQIARTASADLYWQMLNVKLMLNAKCKMVSASEGGLG